MGISRRGPASAVALACRRFPLTCRFRYDGRDVRWLYLFALALVVAALLSAACDDDDSTPPTPEGPTTISLEKQVVDTGEGEFRFTLILTNEGENLGVNVTTSDVWEEGLEVTAIGSVEGQQPEDIGDFGLEFILTEFEPGKTVDLVYTARCRQSGEWDNTAVASATNSEPVQDVVTVTCP